MSEQTVYAVLIETASNQAFVFQSNKLRDLVGASDLVARVGTEWAMAAAEEVGGPQAPSEPTLAERVAYLEGASVLLDRDSAAPVEPVVCTSGKAVFLVRDKAVGETIIYSVTRKALKEAPGLTVRGAVSEAFSLDDPAEKAGCIIARLFEEIERLRLELPPAEARFPSLPVVEPCGVTGLPGEGFLERKGDPERGLLSASSIRKRAVAKLERRRDDEPWSSYERIEADLGLRDGELARNPSDLGETRWHAVIHADGNGFGQVFLDLASYCAPKDTARDYFNLYRELSISLDLVGVKALRQATRTFAPFKDWRPVTETDGRVRWRMVDAKPLAVSVMGGDDLTCVCDGTQALRFTREYLSAFEIWVREEKIDGRPNAIYSLVHRTEVKKEFGAAAGVAIVKTHHPLHRAFELAEALTKSAKDLVKKDLKSPGLTALDFQVVYGDTSSDLKALRSEWKMVDEATSVRASAFAYARPYVASHVGRRPADAERGNRFDRRHIRRLDEAGAQLHKKTNDGRPAFPRSQQHEMREAVLAGRAIADARLKLIAARYQEVDWSAFGGNASTLFFENHGSAPDVPLIEIDFMTRLLDAMDLSDIGANFEPALSTSTAFAVRGDAA